MARVLEVQSPALAKNLDSAIGRDEQTLHVEHGDAIRSEALDDFHRGLARGARVGLLPEGRFRAGADALARGFARQRLLLPHQDHMARVSGDVVERLAQRRGIAPDLV